MQRLLPLWIMMPIITRVSAIWKSSNILLFTGDDGIANGLYNDTIYLLGGYVNRNQITTYEYKTGTLLNIGSNVLSVDVWGFSQYWTQINHTLYLIIPSFDSTLSHIATYNLATNIFTPDFKSIPINDTLEACLTYNDPYLYIIGGKNDQRRTLNSVQTLDLNTMQWIYNVPDFNTQRISFSCIVYHNYIWIFGGPQTVTNERVDITNIENNSWHYVEPLTIAAFGTRCVAFYDVIYIIGGRYKLDSNTKHLDIVHIMDVETGTITVSADKMPYATAFTSPIIADGVLYAFGGTRDVNNNGVRWWMYYNLSYPTSLPTRAPTSKPTNGPILNPTINPTSSSTNIPTYTPTNGPTLNPIKQPASSPTLYPTINPTSSSTNNPTFSPSFPPYINSTKNIVIQLTLTYLWIAESRTNRIKSTDETFVDNQTHDVEFYIIIALIILVVVIVFNVFLCILVRGLYRSKFDKGDNKRAVSRMKSNSISDDIQIEASRHKMPGERDESCNAHGLEVPSVNLDDRITSEGEPEQNEANITAGTDQEYNNPNIADDEFIVE